MAKIFRLHTEGTNAIQGWGDSTKYGTNVIDQIADPNGASATKEITSIPSPFARMDLVKTAFKTVAAGDIEGNTIFHKMVSDSLDVGQVFFQYDKFKEQVEILVWDRNDLNALLNSRVQGHLLLGETYRLFMQQDAATYNFDQMRRLYILNYRHGPNMMNVLGATSPATLFFTTANDLRFAQTLRSGTDILFDNQYAPLYQRDIEYQKYWYLLRRNINNFSTLFPEVNSYLDANFGRLNPNQQRIIRNLNENNINDYDVLSAAGAGNIVEVLGFGLKKQRYDPQTIANQSGFVIQPTVDQAANSLPPLVLPIETLARAGNQPIYTIDPWNRDTKVPIVESRPLNQRTLPCDGSKYPYLTIGDFLEDTIVHIPYEMNANCYFNGNLDATDNNSYLLPIKSLFFNYFTPEDLMNRTMGDGKRMFEMQRLLSGVGVYLRIPIKDDYIEYHRIYGNQADVERNRGAVIDAYFSFGIFPNVKYNDARDAYYRIGLISSFNERNNYDVFCISNNQSLPVTPIIRNQNNNRYKTCKTYVVEHTNFDYCEIVYNQNKGVLIPKFRQQVGYDQFTFAIDFGTTNTHIEYSVNNQPSRAFDTTNREENQMPLLAKMETDALAQYMFDFEFLPEKVGGNSEFRFPIRTVLSEGKNTNWDSACPMANANIPFPYEKRIYNEYNKIITGLKWSNDQDAIQKVRCYIESLFMILRNKVLLNNGNLSQTKIVWFYPISMTAHRFNLFEQVWKESYRKYFGNIVQNVIPITESIAPYQYYRGANPNVNNIVTIDIGGGTSDIVIARNGDVQYITSFRFAANSIFGDAGASAHGAALNGIIRQFYDRINQTLSNDEESRINDLSIINQNIADKNISSDVASFLFSLKDNKNIAEKNLENSVDFDAMLRTDGTQKIVFILFYAAIIYHLAHIMKAKSLEMPRHIAFSGNGSKVINILSPSRTILENYTKLIFENIYGEQYNINGLTLLLNDQPKEATCKGGITNPVAEEYFQIEYKKVVLKSSDNQSFVLSETYGQIDGKYINQTIESVINFIQFVFDLNEQFSYTRNFGLEQSSLDIAREECFRDLNTYMENGLQQKRNEVSDNVPIEETFFFYPINGMLHALCAAICDNQLTPR